MTFWLLPLTLQLVLQSIVLAVVSVPFAKPVGFKEGVLLLQWWDWVDRRWPFTTCVAYVFAGSRWAPDDGAIWFHEVDVHVKQYEDLAVLSDIIALGVYLSTGSWVTALVIWATGGPLWLLPNYLTALRYNQAGKALGWRIWERLCRMSEHERSAYAQEGLYKRNGGA